MRPGSCDPPRGSGGWFPACGCLRRGCRRPGRDGGPSRNWTGAWGPGVGVKEAAVGGEVENPLGEVAGEAVIVTGDGSKHPGGLKGVHREGVFVIRVDAANQSVDWSAVPLLEDGSPFTGVVSLEHPLHELGGLVPGPAFRIAAGGGIGSVGGKAFVVGVDRPAVHPPEALLGGLEEAPSAVRFQAR